ncbi:hypothetical protein B0H13DRAFT_1912880 [Mycena leptocephala]|nr:hypothetical protein B0H13DRAFT_1912880 [Mycena leptocephala]
MAHGRVEPSRVREGPAIEEELVRRAELASSVVIRERTACSANIWRSITPLTSVQQQEGIELGPHGSWRDFHRAKTLRTRREGARWTWLYLRLQTANQTQGPRIVEPTRPKHSGFSALTRALWVGAHDRESNTRGLNMEPRATSRTSRWQLTHVSAESKSRALNIFENRNHIPGELTDLFGELTAEQTARHGTSSSRQNSRRGSHISPAPFSQDLIKSVRT